MKTLVLLALAGIVFLTQPVRAMEPAATLRVDVKDEKQPVSPTLYGIFMEEISHAFDGGIYGELIQNRSFEEGVLPPGMKIVKKPDGSLKLELESLPAGVPKDKWDMPWPWFMGLGWDLNRATTGWSLEPRGGAKGEMKITEANPMNAASSRSLAMTVYPGEAPDARVALVNSGYWGIHVQTGVSYRLKFHLRPEGYRGQLSASLESGSGTVLARHDFGTIDPSSRWHEYAAELKADGNDPRARFVLSFRGEGTLQVDWVSLFPPTYKDRPNGLRKDLARLLEEYKPSFIRYPGGCYVEGYSWQQAPDWRTMVCPPEERPGMWGYWKYRSTDGFGYHEFLEFCEDIGADAMYVAFAGMTVHPENNWPLDKIEPVIQQTLDAIEYAIGPVDSKWGAVRAKMGHPRPFPLKYVEIGNEHPPALYGDYYRKFRDAIKAKYPQIAVIMSMFWSGLNPGAIQRAGDANIDVVDEHSYKPSGWIRTNFDYFDRYPRKPWKIYVGEYAHHHNSGDWSAAMDDAVYLMMLERNGDLVTMASYAPLFANLQDRSWGVNLIEFDSSRSFAHASYYVQKLFNETRPDVNLALTAVIQPRPDPNRALLEGRFGLGSWHTLNEFKEFRIYDESNNVVLQDDFKSLDLWDSPGVGRWKVEGGVLKQTSTENGPASLFLKGKLQTGRVTLKARRVGGNEGFLMFFGAAGPERYMFCNYGAAGNHFSAIQGTPAEGIALHDGGDIQGPIENNRWYDITLVLKKGSAEMLLDAKRVSKVRAESLPEFFASAGYDRTRKAVVVRAANYHGQAMSLEIDLVNTVSAGPTVQHVIISADRMDAENSLTSPQQIVPRTKELSGCGRKFTVELPPRSVNVLRIPVQK